MKGRRGAMSKRLCLVLLVWGSFLMASHATAVVVERGDGVPCLDWTRPEDDAIWSLQARCGGQCEDDRMTMAATSGQIPPSVWLGTAPFCAASQHDCEILGLNYVRRDTSGDGLPCLCGHKVLCEVPEILPTPGVSDRVTSFTVVQYNVMDTPVLIGHEGQRERVCRIPQVLARHVASHGPIDAVVFNESFVGVCAPGLNMTDILAYYGWSHYLSPLSTWWKPSNGGIFIASKWPIIASQEMAYRACSASDCLAAKGVQYAKIKKTVGGRSKFFHVFGTHLQGYLGRNVAEVRRRQLHEMAEFVAQQRIPDDEPVLLAGDFNIRGPSGPAFQYLVETLRVSVPAIVGERRATMDVDNTFIGRGPWWVDYVLPSAIHQQPVAASMEVVALRTEREFAICTQARWRPYYVSPDAPACTRTRHVRDLSDHYPVIGRFEYAH